MNKPLSARAVRVAPVALAVIGAVAFAASAAEPAASAPDMSNAGVSIWTQNVTQFRKNSGAQGGYTKKWDLSDLPHYTPRRQVTGTLRIWGNNYIKDGTLSELWRAGFAKFQPGIQIEYVLPTVAIAIPALAAGTADIGMGNRASLSDLLMFEQTYHYPVSEIAVATGSFDVYGWSPAHIIVVNKDNPLSQITMKQLDGAFGAARDGGYVGSVWHSEYPYARGPEENIRTWGQMGLTGEWADKPINVGGQNLWAGSTINLSQKLTKGSHQFREGYRTFTNYILKDGKINSWSKQAAAAIAKDRYALYWATPLMLNADMKELAVQGDNGGPFVKRTLETVHDRSYPLWIEQKFFYNRKPGQPVDPKVEEFVRYVLSQEGQDAIQQEGKYIPLTGDIVKRELKRLD